MALTPITITFGDGDAPVVNPDSSLANGAMTFTLTSSEGVPISIEDSGTGETVLPVPQVAAVNNGQLLHYPVGGAGYTPFILLANDDVTTVPVGSYYLVHEELAAGNVDDWQFIVHAAAVDGFESLVSQRPS